MPGDLNGVLVVDKPLGPTSFDVVRQVRKALRVQKVGHTGTLDPMASGVLPICLGEATRVAGYITEGNKAYEAVVALGRETDTQDATGKVVSEGVVPTLTVEAIEGVLASFRGVQMQVPPMYSAVKIDGKRLYELAREGKEVERKPREVTVHSLVLKDFSATQWVLHVKCSKGFFVRTLAHDIGRKLNCGAHLKSLRRTQSGPFLLSQALTLEDVLNSQDIRPRLVSAYDALSELPLFVVSEADVARVCHGVPLEAHGEGRVRVVTSTGLLLAVADIEKGRLSYRRVLIQNP